MLGFHNASIKRHSTLSILFICIIAVLFSVVGFALLSIHNFKNTLLNEVEEFASIVGDKNATALIFRDDELAENSFDVFEINQSIVRVCLYDEYGQVFARYPNKGSLITCPRNIEERSAINNKSILVMKEIKKKEETLGTIYIEADTREVEQYTKDQINIAIKVALSALVVSFLSACLIFVRRVC